MKNLKIFEAHGYAMPPKISSMLEDDGEGNYVFYHYSNEIRTEIKPSDGTYSRYTSREEKSALSSVGGLAMFYTNSSDKESFVGDALHVVKIPHDKVYHFNSDLLEFYDVARSKFLEKRPGQAFNPNYQLAWITKVANENGFEMTVAEWGRGLLRAQTTLTLEPTYSKMEK